MLCDGERRLTAAIDEQDGGQYPRRAAFVVDHIDSGAHVTAPCVANSFFGISFTGTQGGAFFRTPFLTTHKLEHVSILIATAIALR